MDKVHELELVDCLKRLTQPVLGICLGMQMFYQFSEEGDANCLGILEGMVKRIPSIANFPIPHMGWNQVNSTLECQLMKGIPTGSYFYFVHSFRAPHGHETLGTTHYGEEIPAIIEHQNWFGTQFHPERSGVFGAILLTNFLNI